MEEKKFKKCTIIVLVVVMGIMLTTFVTYLVCSKTFLNSRENSEKNETINECMMESAKGTYMTKGDFLHYIWYKEGGDSTLVSDYLKKQGCQKALEVYQGGNLEDFIEKYDRDYAIAKYLFSSYLEDELDGDNPVFDNDDLKDLCEPVSYEFAARAIVQYIYRVARDINRDVSSISLSNEKQYKYANDIKIYMKSTNTSDDDFSRFLTPDEVASIVETAIDIDDNSHYPSGEYDIEYKDDVIQFNGEVRSIN